MESIAVWELLNLQQLNLQENDFIRLDFSLLRLPRLKFIDVSNCSELVELSDLPSSISVVRADDCESLESIGDISNCKWLWKVSLWGKNRLRADVGDILLESMLQGNAQDYFINTNFSGIHIWRGFVRWLNRLKSYKMPLPPNWYYHFSGMLMFHRPSRVDPHINIIFKHGVEKYCQCERHEQEFGETVNVYDEARYPEIYVGYVSFRSLRHTGCFNSTYNMISFSINDEPIDKYMLKVVLVPKDDPMQTTKVATDSSEFWDEEKVFGRKTFTIQHHSNSSVEILWCPGYGYIRSLDKW